MKKIAFFVQWMLCGGVENALISLSSELANRGNMVTVYVIKEKGGFIERIPDSVRLLEIPMESRLRNSIPVGGVKLTVRECLKQKKYQEALSHIIKYKTGKTTFAELNIELNPIPYLDEDYDIAVNYHMHSPFLVWYLSERVRADKKYTWIHNDFSTTGYDIRMLKKYLDCVDRFFAVSQQLKSEFAEIVPECALRTETALNIVQTREIIGKSKAYFPEEYKDNDCLRILTVGRLEEQKGYDLAIGACKKLKSSRYKFVWYVIGDGSLKKSLEKSIKKNNLQDCFVLLGTRMNPYPYFRYCDIYAQTSKHEGYATTITEAMLFARPIVTTDVSGAREQLADGINGEIADIDEENIYNRLKKLIDNKRIREKYSLALTKTTIMTTPAWLSAFE